MTFTVEQRTAVEQTGSVLITIDGIECVVLRADVFQRFQSALADGLNDEELLAMLAFSAQGSDWLNPSMDIYDNYEAHR